MAESVSDWPSDPSSAVLVLDFDGTLAPIVDDPTTSRMPAETAAVVERLATRLARVAIVSGRPAGFLHQWAAVPGVSLFGLYGLEKVVDDEVVPDSRVAAFNDALAAARDRLAAAVGEWPGSRLEDKGNALAVHWRQANDPSAAAPVLTSAAVTVAERHGLRVDDGKMVVELRPDVDGDKGMVVTELAADHTDVAFAGDDVGDLPALAAVERLGGLRIVVDHGAETAPEVRAAGDVVVDGVTGMADWLAALADRLG